MLAYIGDAVYSMYVRERVGTNEYIKGISVTPLLLSLFVLSHKRRYCLK